MKIYSSLIQLAALGALSSAAVAADTSAWKCETCPYPKGVTATVEVGAGTVSGSSAKFGDFSGLASKGEHVVLGGTLDYRSGSGYYAGFAAEDLGLDSRRLSATSGLEGVYQLRLGYGELPRHLADGARSPYSGGSVLTLPALGYPAGTTSGMPASSLLPVDIATKRQRFDLDGRFMAGDNFTYRVTLRRDVRDGTQSTYGSFFDRAAQLPLALDHTTDQLEVSAAYVARGMHATVAWQLSQFKNDIDSVTFANPFTALRGATRGQLAQAPDNKLQQLSASGGYEITPTIKVSGDVAVGRLTQDAAFLAPTLNAGLTPGALPAASLDGEVETFNGSLRLSAAPVEGLRLNASVSRDRRDNRTAVRAYPQVATDIFVTTPRSNTPFGFTLDRLKLSADYRGPGSWKFSAGADHDRRERTYAEAVQTRETTLWGRASVRPLDDMTLAFKLAHGKREHSTYGTATWFGSTENPLLRKFNLAERERDSVGVRTDFALTEKLTLGLTLDYNSDAYGQSLVGLRSARSFASALDMAVALSEQTQITAYVQGETVTSRQRGSEGFATPDWAARNRDQFSTFGLGIKHAAIADKLDIGADVSLSRSRTSVAVDNGIVAAGFPEARTTQDSFKLYANVKLQDNLWLKLSGWYETYDMRDWHADGVLPATVQNLLSFGSQAPQYSLTVLRASLSYRF
ncbi:conserved exported hypothetical protein [Rubrivivax sp. A210]|uniref:MtrB/PioB family decaheme-associated outer membrane protein n=1 Tax=Rubrivivax sp. A210 TaxID=2772301 RepID=UPI00191ADB72|nr:MtrB/PioB family decaheme-associated outer membrane protein [Rubrivivax sp. A210]CAD5375040.1 conserved exported hypothetical protein [Rubrivivax sp. A210]